MRFITETSISIIVLMNELMELEVPDRHKKKSVNMQFHIVMVVDK